MCEYYWMIPIGIECVALGAIIAALIFVIFD